LGLEKQHRPNDRQDADTDGNDGGNNLQDARLPE